MSDPDLDPFAVRPNAPISIVKSAKSVPSTSMPSASSALCCAEQACLSSEIQMACDMHGTMPGTQAHISGQRAVSWADTISVVYGIAMHRASLREPTRPQTPSSDLGRQLFGRDSAFAQNRPPSAYGVPGR